MDLAAENGERAMVEIVKKAPVKLLEAKREKYRWFNTFQEKRKELDINFDHRRTWFPEKMRDFNHLMRGQYESAPLNVESLCHVKRCTPKAAALAYDSMMCSIERAIPADLKDGAAYYDSSLTKRENAHMNAMAYKEYLR
jgi:hypothetical protein